MSILVKASDKFTLFKCAVNTFVVHGSLAADREMAIEQIFEPQGGRDPIPID
jgi:hypothetical protein